MDRSLVGEFRYNGVAFKLGLKFAKVYSPAIFETYFSSHKHILIAATDYFMLLYPPDGVRWILWISLCYTASTVCREISPLRCNEKNIILKNKMAATGVFSTFSKDFCGPSRAKGIIGRDLKFARYVHHYKLLTGNILGLIFENKMAVMGVSLSVMKSAYIALIICPRVLGW